LAAQIVNDVADDVLASVLAPELLGADSLVHGAQHLAPQGFCAVVVTQMLEEIHNGGHDAVGTQGGIVGQRKLRLQGLEDGMVIPDLHGTEEIGSAANGAADGG